MAVRAELLRPGFNGAESMRTAPAAGEALALMTVLPSFGTDLTTGLAVFRTASVPVWAVVADSGLTAVCADVLIFFSGVFTKSLLWESASDYCLDRFFASLPSAARPFLVPDDLVCLRQLLPECPR
jgi:hypothetical protein